MEIVEEVETAQEEEEEVEDSKEIDPLEVEGELLGEEVVNRHKHRKIWIRN